MEDADQGIRTCREVMRVVVTEVLDVVASVL